jgi:CRP-like cAMP-binding protein
VTVDKGELLLKEGDPVNYMLIVKEGEVEIFKDIDSTIFVIDKLGRGSVINFRNFYFKEENIKFNLRSSERSTILMISIKRLYKVLKDNPRLETNFII